jgi:hypothetical protein
MKTIIATQLLIAAAAISVAPAGEITSTERAGAQAANQATDSKTLLYGRKGFEHWHDTLATELKPDRQIEALQALGAFAANGRSREAATAIAAFMNQPGRLPADEALHAKLIRTAVQAITRADEADVMALVRDSARLAGDPAAEFWRGAQSHFQTYTKSYEVAELIPAPADKAGPRPDLSRFVSELKTQFPPRTWHEHGGKSDIDVFETNQTLIVSAPASIHRAMDKVLADMRKTHPLTRRYEIRHLIATNTSINRAKQDFDALADLISTNIAPTSWENVGGAGAMHQDHSTMMLVVSHQPVETHEQIADLLQQLSALAASSSKLTVPAREETKRKD